jgi:hypothetical protein
MRGGTNDSKKGGNNRGQAKQSKQAILIHFVELEMAMV